MENQIFNFICFFLSVYMCIKKKFIDRIDVTTVRINFSDSRVRLLESLRNWIKFRFLFSPFPSRFLRRLSIFLLRLVNSIIMSVRLRVSVDYVVVTVYVYFLLLIDFLTIVAGLFRPRGCWGCDCTASRSNCFSCCP